jgi:hypothetical protein
VPVLIIDRLSEDSALADMPPGSAVHTTKQWHRFENSMAESGGTVRQSEAKPPLTAIPAEVLAVDRLSDQYRVIVRIGLAKYRGSYDTLIFGEQKPLVGSCRDGHLDLIYLQDPGIEPGQEFPLWTIQ